MALALLLHVGAVGAVIGAGPAPTDDPVASLYPTGPAGPGREGINGFSSQFPWSNVETVALDAVDGGGDPAAAYTAAAAKVLAQNPAGGVVFFPAGTYTFKGDLTLQDGVLVRGAVATGAALKAGTEGNGSPGSLSPTTVFSFPDRSYSRIACINCTVAGVINVKSDGGAIALQRPPTPKGAARPAMFVALGNLLVNVVYKYPIAPPATGPVEWPYRFSTAIAVTTGPNTLVANNLLAKATKSATTKINFAGVAEAAGSAAGAKPPPPPPPCSLTVPFPYDNRYGIWVTVAGTQVTSNVTVADNYVYMNGRVGIIWGSNDGLDGAAEAQGKPSPQGTGVAIVRNHVETAKDTTCWSVDGVHMTHGSSTNENRGYDQIGVGSYVAYNTGAIRRQHTTANCAVSSYMTVDGEGILQQIQDGAVAQRNIWTNNDLRPSEGGNIELYALHAVQDMTITDNWSGNGAQNPIGIVKGGSTPPNGTGHANLVCSGNHPKATCA